MRVTFHLLLYAVLMVFFFFLTPFTGCSVMPNGGLVWRRWMGPQLRCPMCPALNSGTGWGDLTKRLQSQVRRNCKAGSTGGWRIGNPKFRFLGKADCRASEDQNCQIAYSRNRIIFLFKAPVSIRSLGCQERREANAVAQLCITACVQSRSVGGEGLVTHL